MHQIGLSDTARGSSELVKAHTPRSCRNTADHSAAAPRPFDASDEASGPCGRRRCETRARHRLRFCGLWHGYRVPTGARAVEKVTERACRSRIRFAVTCLSDAAARRLMPQARARNRFREVNASLPLPPSPPPSPPSLPSESQSRTPHAWRRTAAGRASGSAAPWLRRISKAVAVNARVESHRPAGVGMSARRPRPGPEST